MESSGTSASGPDGIPSKRATELVAESFATVWRNFWGFLRLGLILYVVFVAASLIPFVGSVVLAPVVTAAVVIAAAFGFSRDTVPAIGSIRASFSRLLPVVGGMLLYLIAIALLAVTVIGIPYAIHLMIRWSFVIHAIMLEKLSIRLAFARSTELVRGQWWRIFGCVALMGLAVMGFFVVTAGLWLGSIPLWVAFSNVGIVFTTLLYIDSRARKEGYSRSQLDAEISAYA